MAKKYFGTKSYANLPKEVSYKTYPKRGVAITEGSYVDTQPELDSEYNKAIGKLRRGMNK